MKKKILFLSTRFPYPPSRGHFLRTYNTILGLSKNYNIYFLSFTNREITKEEVEHLKNCCVLVETFYAPADKSKFGLVWLLFKNIFSSKPFVAEKYYFKPFAERIKEILKKENIDLVHLDMLPLSMYLSLFENYPKILVDHNVESLRLKSWVEKEKSWVKKLYLWIQYKKLFKFESKMCGKVDLCIAVSNEDKRELLKMNPQAKVEVVPNGVDVDYFKKDEGVFEEKNTIIWTGGTGEFYNRSSLVYFFQKILPIIKSSMPEIKFYIIGKIAGKSLEKEISKNKQNVFLAGYVEDIRPWMNKASVFVAPILAGGGTKLKVLNAMAMSKPVVTTTKGAEGIEGVNGEHFLVADEPKEFACKVLFLLKNPDVAKEIGENARRLVEDKYSWVKIWNNMNNLYEKMLQNSI